MNSETPVKQRETEAPVGSEELAEGLMLVRASTLKMIRLQLAMERHDRVVAQEAVDDLVALDRRLEDYLADVSAPLMFRSIAEGAFLNPHAWQNSNVEKPRRFKNRMLCSPAASAAPSASASGADSRPSGPGG